MQGGDHLLVDQMVRGGGRQLFPGNKFAQVDRILLGQQQDHVMAGAEDKGADRLAIRRLSGEQGLRRFGVRAKIVTDKIGDPLAAGEIQVVFRAKIVGDSGDILPGLGGDVAGGGVLAVLAKLGDSGRGDPGEEALDLLLLFISVGKDEVVRADRHAPFVGKHRRQLSLAHMAAGQQIAFQDHPHPHPGRLDAHVRPVEIKDKVFVPAADLVPRQPVAPVN